MIGISRDLGTPDGEHPVYDRLKQVLAYMQSNYAQSIRVQALAGFSIAQREGHSGACSSQRRGRC